MMSEGLMGASAGDVSIEMKGGEGKAEEAKDQVEFDYAMVFEELVGADGKTVVGSEYVDPRHPGVKFNFQSIIDRIEDSGMYVGVFRSKSKCKGKAGLCAKLTGKKDPQRPAGTERKYVFVLIGCSDERLSAAADQVDYLQPLDKAAIQTRLEHPDGRPGYWETIYSTDKWVRGEQKLDEGGGTRSSSGSVDIKSYYNNMHPHFQRGPFQDLFAPWEESPIEITSKDAIRVDNTKFTEGNACGTYTEALCNGRWKRCKVRAIHLAEDTGKENTYDVEFVDGRSEKGLCFDMIKVYEDLRRLYDTGKTGETFDTLDRKRLIEIILKKPHDAKPAGSWRGAGLDLKNLEAAGVYEAFYPLHEKDALAHVRREWTSCKPKMDGYRDLCGGLQYVFGTKPEPYRFTSERMDTLKEYFGEKVALYFAFVNHFTIWMVLPGLLGLIIAIVTYVSDAESARLVNTLFNDTVLTPDGGGPGLCIKQYKARVKDLSAKSETASPPLFGRYRMYCWLDNVDMEDHFVRYGSLANYAGMSPPDSTNYLSKLHLAFGNGTKFQSCEPVMPPYQVLRRGERYALNATTQNHTWTPLGCVQSPDNMWWDVPVLPFYGLIIALWSTAILDYWRRKQAIYSLEWGMGEYEETEELRSEYIKHPDTKNVVHPIEGDVSPYFPDAQYIKRHGASKSVIITFALAIMGVVAGVVLFRTYMAYLNSFQPETFPAYLRIVTPYFAALLNTVQIVIFGIIWTNVARWLNDLENHPTYTAYEDSLILKTFIFQFINNFASLIYIVIQEYVPICYGDPVSGTDSNCRPNLCVMGGGCVALLSKQLLTIFLCRVLLSNIGEVKGVVITILKPFIRACCPCLKTPEVEDVDLKSPAELEFGLKEYNIYSQIADYLELVLQFGYITFFVVAWPMAPFVALLNNFLECRLDMSKLCIECRRPRPLGAEDIGTWDSILEFMGYFAVFMNILIIVFHGHFSWIDLDYQSRLITFIVAEHALIVTKWGFNYFVGSVPKDCALQLERQRFIVGKLIHNHPDEQEDGSICTLEETLRAPREGGPIKIHGGWPELFKGPDGAPDEDFKLKRVKAE